MCVDTVVTKAHESIIAHKANIRGGGKTVHVVFNTCPEDCLLYKGLWAGGIKPIGGHRYFVK